MPDNNRERDNYDGMVTKSPALTALVDYFRSETAWKDETLQFSSSESETVMNSKSSGCGEN